MCQSIFIRRLARFLQIDFQTITMQKNTTMAEEKEIKIEEQNAGEQAQPQEEQSVNTDKTAEGTTETDNKTEEEISPLEKAQAEVEELKKQLLYKSAEFENYRKRTLKEKAELILNGGEKTITAILPILDDFERALADKSDDPQAIKEGVQMIFNKFYKALESLGVKKIETTGKDFDVDFHEAIAIVPGMGDEMKGKVIDCVQTGYTMNDKVIRHAKVAVGQ